MKSLSHTFKKSTANDLFFKPLNSFITITEAYTITKGTIVFSQDFKCGKVVLVRVEKEAEFFPKDEDIIALWLSQCGQSGIVAKTNPYSGQNVDPDVMAALDTYNLSNQNSEFNEEQFYSLHPLMSM